MGQELGSTYPLAEPWTTLIQRHPQPLLHPFTPPILNLQMPLILQSRMPVLPLLSVKCVCLVTLIDRLALRSSIGRARDNSGLELAFRSYKGIRFLTGKADCIRQVMIADRLAICRR